MGNNCDPADAMLECLAYIFGKTVVPRKMLLEIRMPDLGPRVQPPTRCMHPKKKKQISPFGFFIYYIKKSDMISKIQFLNSIFLKFFWDFIFYIDEADDSVLLVYCI